MKLLEELAEQIKELGSIKRVWFTTFNLNLEFFERHVLPTILQMDKPKNRIDYELMQQRLNGKVVSGKSSSGNNYLAKIDISIFADQRMYDASDLKRTAIDVYSINPTQLQSSLNLSQQALFHPKVIYLEAEDGKAILGAGSANLTLSGWSNNQEVFAFRKIAANSQRKAVDSFYSALFSSVGLPNKKKTIARKLFPEADQQWQFIHSLAKPNFLDALFTGSAKAEEHELAVWSPYLPADLASFITRLESRVQKITGEKLPLSLQLSPDRVENKFIRTKWSEKVELLQQSGMLNFYNQARAIEKHENCDLCHAKIWMTSNRLAIGSWNFTTPGSNLLLNNKKNDEPHINIEAGFIFEHKEHVHKQLGQKFEAKNNDFMSSERLEEHSLEVSKLLPFDIRVSFDWRTLKYTILLSAESALITGYQLKLPDIDDAIKLDQLSGSTTEILVDEPHFLLSQHSYEVRYHNRLLHRGFIIETQSELRRVEHFDTLDDIFNSLIAGADLEGNGDASLRPQLITDQDPDDEGNENFTDNGLKASTLSYFRMFQACSEFDIRLDEISSIELLEQYAFVVPGCLIELKEKIEDEISSGVSVLNWYMVQEYNLLVNRALNKIVDNNDDLVRRISNLLISIEPTKGQKILGKKKYRNLIQSECGYVS